MSKSKIEWTGETWNPLIGCDKISAGCKNCYAITTAWIRQHNPKMQEKFAGTVEKGANGQLNWTGKLNMSMAALDIPLNNKKPTVYFVNSMSDLFHEAVPFDFIDKIFCIMAITQHHTYQVLTKRAYRMVEYFKSGAVSRIYSELERIAPAGQEMAASAMFHLIKYQYLPNVWIGVSAEDQKTADDRVPKLLDVPAAVRFLSCEPLLGDINLSKYLLPLKREGLHACRGIHWVIAGGESGKDARPMHPDWARSLRDQCRANDVPFFFKQWGEYSPYMLRDIYTEDKPLMFLEADGQFSWWAGDIDTTINYSTNYTGHGQAFDKVGKKAAGNVLDGRTHEEYPKRRTDAVSGN
ncbi:MAG: phage Gp37/Gp68 family protein [Bacteroidota bacterium]